MLAKASIPRVEAKTVSEEILKFLKGASKSKTEPEIIESVGGGTGMAGAVGLSGNSCTSGCHMYGSCAESEGRELALLWPHTRSRGWEETGTGRAIAYANVDTLARLRRRK